VTAWVIPRRILRRLKPATVIDVGVHKGTPALYAAFPNAQYLLVEPIKERVPDLEKILTTIRGEYVIAAAGAQEGTATLRIEPAPAASSLLDRASGSVKGADLERREVTVVTLDGLVAERNLEGPFGLKVDTEGFELEVIYGATTMLESCQFVIAEMTTSRRRFRAGYRSVELIDEMSTHGFLVRAVMHSTRNYADVLFVRKGLVPPKSKRPEPSP